MQSGSLDVACEGVFDALLQQTRYLYKGLEARRDDNTNCRAVDTYSRHRQGNQQPSDHADIVNSNGKGGQEKLTFTVEYGGSVGNFRHYSSSTKTCTCISRRYADARCLPV